MLFDGSDETPDVAGPRRRRRAASRCCPTTCGSRRWAGTRSTITPGSRLGAHLPDPAWLYFVHSYAPEPDDDARRRGVVRLRPPVRGRDRGRPGLGDAVPPREVGRGRHAHARRTSSTRSRARCGLMDLYPVDRPPRGPGRAPARAATTSVQTVYDDDPVAVARRFDAAGARWIHVVDLDAALDGGNPNLVGHRGDLRERRRAGADRRRRAHASPTRASASRAGVARVVIGSAAVEHPEVVDELRALHPGSGRGRARRARPRRRDPRLDRRDRPRPRRRSRSSSTARASARSIVTDIARDGMLVGPGARPTRGRRRRGRGPGDRERRRRHARRPARARRFEVGGKRLAGVDRRPRDLREPVHRRGRDRRVLAVRVIPCLDVDARPGRQGRELRRHPRRGRSGRARGALRRRRRRRARVPRHHRVERRARHDGARRRAGRGTGVHPVHGRRGSPHRRGRAPHAARRRRQGLVQHRRGRTIPSSCAPARRSTARSASSSRSTPAGATTAAGRS